MSLRQRITHAVASVLLALLVVIPASAQVPRTISFQGVLADASGVLVPDGQQDLTISIYDIATGGVPIFSETQRVTVVRGVFNAIIGAVDPSGIPPTIAFDKPYWLGVKVGTAGVELTPRTAFTSVPYALNAAVAQVAHRADTATWSARAGDADTAGTVRGGYVTSLNGGQGAVELLGAGTTTVTTSGNQVIIRTDPNTSGIQRLESFDGSLVLDPPTGPFMTAHVRQQGIQTVHLRDSSITNGKIISNAVDAQKVHTRDADPRTALMAVGVPTPMWLNPIHVNLAYHDVLESDSALWFLTNSGRGGGGAYALTSPTNDASAMLASTEGRGIAVEARAHAAGTGIAASSQGGIAGEFQIPDAGNTSDVLQATSVGLGSAGHFAIDNPTNESAVTTAQTNGIGSGGFFLNTGAGRALEAVTEHDATVPTLYVARRRPAESGGSIDERNELDNTAIDAENHWAGGVGVAGRSQDGIGLYGYTESGEAAIKGVSTGLSPAGLFAGNVEVVGDLHVTGTVSKAGGTFKIDHPLDPANKYLYHSFVESPEMKNIYDGVVTLDAKGAAVVTMPAWFEALNREFRYQLTCVGGYAPVYVAEEMKGNTFAIAGGTPGLKVSWQVTGVRHDRYAEENRVQVEVEKPAAERGTFLYPGSAVE